MSRAETPSRDVRILRTPFLAEAPRRQDSAVENRDPDPTHEAGIVAITPSVLDHSPPNRDPRSENGRE